MESSRRNILFVHKDLKSFVKADLKILESAHNVRVVKFSWSIGFIKDVISGISWCDLVFGWWASWHMLLPVFLANKYKKPIIIVGGDYDVIYEKQFRTRIRIIKDNFRKIISKYLFGRISVFLTFSKFSLKKTLDLHYVNSEKVQMLYIGIPNIEKISQDKKEELVITVGEIDQYNIYRKGYETFVKSALNLPNINFKFIGEWKDHSIDQLRDWNNNNVEYLGNISTKELYETMALAKVYVQVSHHEGFGLALAEAMLFECFPVITERGAIPEVVGDCGYYVPFGDVEATTKAILDALDADPALGKLNRKQVLSNFPLENRRKGLLKVVEKI